MSKHRCALFLLALSTSAVAEAEKFHTMIDADCFELNSSNEELLLAWSSIGQYIKEFAAQGLRSGSCSSAGYSTVVQHGSIPLNVPFVRKPLIFQRMQRSSWEAAKLNVQAHVATILGKITNRQVHRVLPHLKDPQSHESMYMISDGHCGEIHVDAFSQLLAQLDGYEKGSCHEMGFTNSESALDASGKLWPQTHIVWTKQDAVPGSTGHYQNVELV